MAKIICRVCQQAITEGSFLDHFRNSHPKEYLSGANGNRTKLGKIDGLPRRKK